MQYMIITRIARILLLIVSLCKYYIFFFTIIFNYLFDFSMAACNGGATTLIPFSNMSISAITATINSATCLINAQLSYCGNGVVEPPEQCDCGSSCASDPYCTTSCTLVPGAQCSTS